MPIEWLRSSGTGVEQSSWCISEKFSGKPMPASVEASGQTDFLQWSHLFGWMVGWICSSYVAVWVLQLGWSLQECNTGDRLHHDCHWLWLGRCLAHRSSWEVLCQSQPGLSKAAAGVWEIWSEPGECSLRNFSNAVSHPGPPSPFENCDTATERPTDVIGPRFPCTPGGGWGGEEGGPACSVLLRGSFAALLYQVLHICLFLSLWVLLAFPGLAYFLLIFSFSYLSLWAIRVITNQMRVEGGVSHTNYGNSSVRFSAGIDGVTSLCSDSELQTLTHAIFSMNSLHQSRCHRQIAQEHIFLACILDSLAADSNCSKSAK